MSTQRRKAVADDGGKPREPSILIVDDESQTLSSYEVTLNGDGHDRVVKAESGEMAMKLIGENDFSVVLLDLWMPGVGGEAALEWIVENHPDLPVVIVTAADEASVAVSCMKAGAFDFLVKPVKRDRLLSVIRHAIKINELKRENQLLREGFFKDELERPEIFAGIITRHKEFLRTFRYIESIARTGQPVLITGETGAGKELVAKAVHDASGRSGNFVSINVAGLDDSTFSDTLFGHRKGAFTGAAGDRQGLVEKAAGGTLFLDEIGDLGENSQIKLLRLLQEREYYPLGSDVPAKTDARLVTATNKHLRAMMIHGEYRKDLFYRLQSHQVRVPALRERMDDLELLIEFFIKQAADELQIEPCPIPEGLLELLQTYDFPGNIRELQSMIFDGISSPTFGSLSIDYFKRTLAAYKANGDADDNESPSTFDDDFDGEVPTLKDAEMSLIQRALEKTDGNMSKAADLLGVSRVTLHRKLKKS